MNDLRNDVRDAFQRRLDAAPIAPDLRVRIEERATRRRRHWAMPIAAVAAVLLAVLAGGTLVYVASHLRKEPAPVTTPTPHSTPSANPTPTPTAAPTPTPSVAPAAPQFTRFPLVDRFGPAGMVVGPDGALWYTDSEKIVRIDAAGAATSYTIPHPAGATGITVGPDGALWFAENAGNRIGRITTSGALTEYPIPTANSQPLRITSGPDGALWFTEMLGNKIGRITTGGQITEFALPDRGEVQCGELCPAGITAGSDGALWFTESQFSAGGGNRIGRITVDGHLTEYQLPVADALPYDIAPAPDGTLWFTQRNGIGSITMSGAIQEHTIPGTGSRMTIDGLAVGSDGRVWFTENEHKTGTLESTRSWIGFIDAGGAFNTIDVPAGVVGATGLAAGPDGTFWFSTDASNGIQLWRMTQ